MVKSRVCWKLVGDRGSQRSAGGTRKAAYLAVPNKFFGDWLRQHYGDLLAESVADAG
jgi:hypothetical protein